MGRCSGQTGTVPGTNGTRPWDKLGPVPGTNRDPSLGHRPFSIELHSTIAILSCFSLGRVEVHPWDQCVPQWPSEKSLCVIFLLVFFFARSWTFWSTLPSSHSPSLSTLPLPLSLTPWLFFICSRGGWPGLAGVGEGSWGTSKRAQTLGFCPFGFCPFRPLQGMYEEAQDLLLEIGKLLSRLGVARFCHCVPKAKRFGPRKEIVRTFLFIICNI